MTYNNPTYQNPAPQDLQTLLEAMQRGLLKNLNCVKIGVIQDFNAATQEATIQIAMQQVTSISPDGVRTLAEYPLLLNVPIVFPAGGGFTLTFPIAAGDECLLLFNDRSISDWLLNGPGFPPSSSLVHDMSDAIAIVGLRSNPRALANVSTTNAQLRSDDGNTLIDVGAGKIQIVADEVVIHGRNKTTFDAGGTGFVYTPSQIDTYTTGVTVVTHAPHPPEVPT